MTDLVNQAQDGFEEAFGYSPLGIWSAPGRVNLIGEHTALGVRALRDVTVSQLLAAGDRLDAETYRRAGTPLRRTSV